MSASASVRIYTSARIYVYARSSELRSSVSERRKERKRERAEKERGRERVDRESTAEVEGRLASIRERDADRVGESWVRSHKEVDTRRHLNPPCPPSRRPPRAPSVLLGATPPPCRHPIANLRSDFPRPLTPRSFRLSISPTLARLAPGIYCSSFSLSLPPSVAILSLHRRSLRVALFPPSRRETHPRSRSAKLRLPEDRRGWLEDFFVTAGRCCAS